MRFRWADPQKAPHLIIPFKKQVYEQVLTEFMPIIEQLEKNHSLTGADSFVTTTIASRNTRS